MRKGYYFAQDGLYNDAAAGVGKKIRYQIAAFQKAGIECSFIPIRVYYQSKWGNRILSRFPFGHLYDWSPLVKAKDADFLYIRKIKIDYYFLKALKTVKKEGKARILFEFPTYPYYREFLGFDKLYLMKDRLWRRRVFQYVDRVFLYGTPDQELECDYTPLKNAIHLSDIPGKCHAENELEEIQMISVSTMRFWHGYDRLIEGLKKYYESDPGIQVKVHMVGFGPEEKRYREMVENYHLTQYVVFYGKKTGKELDDIYNLADVGLEGFGFHRKGLMSSTSLKSLEYGAKGIPFVTSTPNDNYDATDFICMMEADESAVDIQRIVDFYIALVHKYQSKDRLRDAIRNYTGEHCSFDAALEPIVCTILS